MLTLIIGPTASGKSRYAEALIASRATNQTSPPARLLYLATMRPQTPENHVRIEKHRRQRASLGFLTVEEPLSLARVPVLSGDVVLLEDVSNLLANAMFEAGESAEHVLSDILALAGRCRWLVAVSITGLVASDYTGETADYIHALNTLNSALSNKADTVVRLTDGHPHTEKGDIHEIP